MQQPPLNPPSAALFDALTRIVGTGNAIPESEAQQRYLREWRGLFVGRTPLIVRPGTAEETAAVLQLCNAARVGVVPQSGNTGLVGGQIPDESGTQILLVLDRLRRIRAIDPAGYTLTAEAGVTLAEIQEAARQADRLFPLSMASEGSCCIGGNLATNAGGISVLAHGTARHLVLGLEVALADGRLWRGLKSLTKDNTGYDLKSLFVGSEGTLGIITAATLKLVARPGETAAAFAAVPRAKALPGLIALARQGAGECLTAFEFMSQRALQFALKHGQGVRAPASSAFPWYALIEVSTASAGQAQPLLESILSEAASLGLIADASLAASGLQQREMWRLREQMSEVQKHEGGSIKHDISLPVARIPEFLERAATMIEELCPGARPVPFGHLGDGNIHYNVSQPPDMDKAEFLAGWNRMAAAVHDLVQELDGSFSAEHGIGRLKRDELARRKDAIELDLMRRIKAALDPNGILNPGALI